MRIITGLLKGRTINIPKTLEVRPTTDRVKEGLFSVIEAYRYIQDNSVLDLFAGSGNLGFEALSRGASDVRFVDNNRENITHIKKIAKEFDITNQARTINLDVKHFLEGPAAPVDLIFADPPYKYEYIEKAVELIFSNGWLQSNGWLILEHNKFYDFSDHTHYLKSKKYGRTIVSFFSAEAQK